MLWTGISRVSGHDLYYCGIIAAVGREVFVCVRYVMTTQLSFKENNSL